MTSIHISFFVSLFTWAHLTRVSESGNILYISFLSSKSHEIIYQPLLQKLSDRGHTITIVNPINLNPTPISTNKSSESNGIRFIQTIPLEEWEKGKSFPNLFELRESTLFNMATVLLNHFLFFGSVMDDICRQSYALPQIRQIATEKYSLILFSPIFNECLYGLVHHLNAPIILLSQVSIMPWTSASLGNPTLTSFLPFTFHGMTDKMTWTQRLGNLFAIVYNDFVLSWIYNPRMEKVYRDMIHPDLPGIREIEAKSVSLALCNSHISFTPPRPLMPDVVEVGGMHLGQIKPLTQGLDRFVSTSGAPDGFILFSMGTALNASTMPSKYRHVFLNTFAELKQKVLWKWEVPEEEDLGIPKNVILNPWLPQQDLLAHKNIKLFITHGGHGSTQEAIYHGVPLVTIPMFGDQQHNSRQAEKHGFAIPLEFTQLTKDVLLEAINKVLKNEKYRESVKNLSRLFRDQIDHPLDRAVYWTEFVMRHNGAHHLRSAARDLNIIQYYSLDSIGFVVGVVISAFYLWFLILRGIFNRFFKSKESGTSFVKKVQ